MKQEAIGSSEGKDKYLPQEGANPMTGINLQINFQPITTRYIVAPIHTCSVAPGAYSGGVYEQNHTDQWDERLEMRVYVGHYPL